MMAACMTVRVQRRIVFVTKQRATGGNSSRSPSAKFAISTRSTASGARTPLYTTKNDHARALPTLARQSAALGQVAFGWAGV